MTTRPADHDLVLSSGRVIDPESGLDAIRNVGISGGTVEAITEGALAGGIVVDAAGLVVCPGFIDLHSHGQDPENYRTQVMDGVTTALELEVGTADVDRWYADRGDAIPINYGVSVGHIQARMAVMNDPGGFLPLEDAAHRPASDPEITEITRIIERGLRRGALAVGLGMVYTPAASRWEVLETFKVAAQTGASCHIHLRGQGVSEPNSSIAGLEEAIAASAITGAPLHVAHIKGTGQGAVPQLLQMIEGARDRGLDVTTECYPYTAGMGFIESSFYDEGWQENMGISYEDLEWADTGERLTAESFARYRAAGGMVVAHVVSPEIVDLTVLSPLTMIATDGLVKNGKGHEYWDITFGS
jgi:N-acyl-D-aspartate/D-glutamate deacylase